MVGHECDAPVSFSVGGVGIPIIDDGITVHEQKGNALTFTRRAEVTFPLRDSETSWVDQIDAFQEGGGQQVATVTMEPLGLNGSPTGEEVPVMRGYIHAIGSQSGENQGHVTVLGPYKAMADIPAGITFNSAQAEDILQWIVDEFERISSLFDSVSLDIRTEIQGTLGKKFTSNRDTLASALKWISDRINIYLWFEPDPNNDRGVTLVVVSDVGEEFDLRSESEPPFIISNNALYEMKPFNAITLKGEGGHTISIPHIGSVNVPVDTVDYPEGTAWYPPLQERAGGQIAREGVSSATTESALAEEAKSRLAKYLSETSGGTIHLALSPQVRPFDRVVAFPGCEGTLDQSLPPLTYEVQRTAHQLSPNNDENDIPQTELSVSMAVDPSKIEVATTTKSATPSKGSDNAPTPEEAFDTQLDFDINNP